MTVLEKILAAPVGGKVVLSYGETGILMAALSAAVNTKETFLELLSTGRCRLLDRDIEVDHG